MKVLLAGHSFVRRLVENLEKHHFKWPFPNHTVESLGMGGGRIAAGHKSLFPSLYQRLDEGDYSILILDLGSNDLDSRRDPEEIARDYVRQVEALINMYNIQVKLVLPIPRAGAKFRDSYSRTNTFNQALTAAFEGRKTVQVWKLRGMFRATSEFLDRDGIHLNATGEGRYFHSLRAAIGRSLSEAGSKH